MPALHAPSAHPLLPSCNESSSEPGPLALGLYNIYSTETFNWGN